VRPLPLKVASHYALAQQFEQNCFVPTRLCWWWQHRFFQIVRSSDPSQVAVDPQRQRTALAQGSILGRPVSSAVLWPWVFARPASQSNTRWQARNLCSKANRAL